MKKIELNLPAEEWDVEYSAFDNGELAAQSITAIGKGNYSGLEISVSRCYCDGDMLAPEEYLESTIGEKMQEVLDYIPMYYQQCLCGVCDLIKPYKFQGRDAAYFVEQKPGDESVIVHAAVWDENCQCCSLTIHADDWLLIPNPEEFLSYLESALVL